VLKKTPERWLIHLAVRAARECVISTQFDPGRTAALIALPDAYRDHFNWEGAGERAFLDVFEARTSIRFNGYSVAVRGGSAEAYKLLVWGRDLLLTGKADHCLVGGVDSLTNEFDVSRLADSGRLHAGAENPQGVIPGEAAAFALIGKSVTSRPALAEILGVSYEHETDSVLGERYSTGGALVRALRAASADARCDEPRIDLRVTDMNGERYEAWESMISTTRFYRTHRERLVTWYPAASVGDTGAAAGVLGIVMGAMGIARGYAPGPVAMLEAASDGGLRAACVMSCVDGARQPPFHPRE